MTLIVLLLVLGSVVAFVVCLHRRATLYYAFSELAARYLGQVYTTLRGSPGALFRFRDIPVRLTARLRWVRNGGRQTTALLDWPDHRFQLVAWTRGTPFRSPVRSTMRSYSAEAGGILERFEIWTNDPSACHALLSPACAWQLAQLVDLAARGHVFWSIRRGKFQIHIGGHFRRPQRLFDVVEKMLDLYSQAQLTQQRGLQFVDEGSAKVIDEMICPICSGQIGRDVAICVRCRTPHCKECWQYNGKCATFGCGAEKSVSPMARPEA